MIDEITQFNPDHFLATYWQKKPVIIRQLLPNFDDPLDEHELASLAMEEDVDSRIIAQTDSGWTLQHGPFEEFESVCTGKWTLMAQGVDRYFPEGSSLMEAFNFIPYWRMDDLMVSFAVEGAGVGPHTDQYDVFLVQGKGSRHWQVGDNKPYQETFPTKGLCQIEGFAPIGETVLQPGDVLYVPPGWAHDGVALSPCLTFSVGFRAPDQSLAVDVLDDIFNSGDVKPERYQDPQLSVSDSPGLVSQEALNNLTGLIEKTLQSEQWQSYLVRHLSNQQLYREVRDVQLSVDEFTAILANGGEFQRLPACRPLFTEPKDGADLFTIYIDGNGYSTRAKYYLPMSQMLNEEFWSVEFIENHLQDVDFLTTLTTLVNEGWWIDIQGEETVD